MPRQKEQIFRGTVEKQPVPKSEFDHIIQAWLNFLLVYKFAKNISWLIHFRDH
jgi:hypothetical protein